MFKPSALSAKKTSVKPCATSSEEVDSEDEGVPLPHVLSVCELADAYLENRQGVWKIEPERHRDDLTGIIIPVNKSL